MKKVVVSILLLLIPSNAFCGWKGWIFWGVVMEGGALLLSFKANDNHEKYVRARLDSAYASNKYMATSENARYFNFKMQNELEKHGKTNVYYYYYHQYEIWYSESVKSYRSFTGLSAQKDTYDQDSNDYRNYSYGFAGAGILLIGKGIYNTIREEKDDKKKSKFKIDYDHRLNGAKIAMAF